MNPPSAPPDNPRFTTSLATLSGIEDRGPNYARMTFRLERPSDFRTVGVAPRLKVFLPRQRGMIPNLPGTDDDGFRRSTESTCPIVRTYTLRAHRPERHEVDIDFVIHPSGFAGQWAAQPCCGDVIGLSNGLGSEPFPTVDDILLVGDLSAVPAITTVVEALPSTTTVRVLITADGPHELILLDPSIAPHTEWVFEHVRTATAPVLVSVVRRSISQRLPDHVWAAGEASQIKQIRTLVRDELAFPAHRVHAAGYWRRDTTSETFESEIVGEVRFALAQNPDLTARQIDDLSI